MNLFYLLLFPVYPEFRMTRLYPTIIDAKKHPEGYVTDYTSKTGGRTSDKSSDIYMDIVNLPTAATVIFNLEVVNMEASEDPYFSIKTEYDGTSEYFIHNNTSFENLTKRISGNRPLRIMYTLRDPSKAGEYVRVKYIGMLIGSKLA